jgi:prevent-host-death family protein
MDTATITEMKNGLSAYIDRVRAGESILVTDRGIPVAVLEPVTGLQHPDLQLAVLERKGLIRRGQGPVPGHLLTRPGPRLPEGASIVEGFLEERESGW